ncbi:hypothetical protein SAMN05421640_3486 [Ekhidna lutea]|uniref:Uncharacterized protein n=1 Tax=Ekhidna lutea TaxID=447679 RepID=A0A239LXJ6_EKHLU|nr:hypothetical protein [Ekhidna lutea]SNT35387.1 hypothetical protein SAMN05421640_3486 [Ekhidna lutea]
MIKLIPKSIFNRKIISLLLVLCCILQSCNEDAENIDDCNVIDYREGTQFTSSESSKEIILDINSDNIDDFKIFATAKAGDEGDSIFFGIEPLNQSELIVFKTTNIAVSFIQDFILEEFDHEQYEWSGDLSYLGINYATPYRTFHKGQWASTYENRRAAAVRLTVGNNIYYGWIRIITKLPDSDLGRLDELIIDDYAIQTLPNEDIMTGSKGLSCNGNVWITD